MCSITEQQSPIRMPTGIRPNLVHGVQHPITRFLRHFADARDTGFPEAGLHLLMQGILDPMLCDPILSVLDLTVGQIGLVELHDSRQEDLIVFSVTVAR